VILRLGLLERYIPSLFSSSHLGLIANFMC
jgi:hypothetical protein